MPIFAGDYYGAHVMVFGKKLWIEKFHIGCPIDGDGDDGEVLPNKIVQIIRLAA